MDYKQVVIILVLMVLCAVSARDPIPGGRYKLKTNDDTVEEMMNFAMETLDGSYNVIAIIKAEAQVVAGIKYYITAVVSEADTDGASKCEFIIFDQPWTGTRELLSVDC